MKITGFIWLEEIVHKLIWKHSVETYEVLELFQNHPRIHFVEKGHQKNENVYAGLGRTGAGRYLIWYFVHKLDIHRSSCRPEKCPELKRNFMARSKSSVSKKGSYKEVGECWDSHDLSEITGEIEEVALEFDPSSDVRYFALENSLSSELRSIAKKRGISTETLVNRWLKKRVGQGAERG